MVSTLTQLQQNLFLKLDITTIVISSWKLMQYQPSGKHQTPSPPPSLFQPEDGEGEGDFYVQNMENKLRRVQRAR